MTEDKNLKRTLSIRISTDGFCFCDYIPAQPDSLQYFFYETDKEISLAANLRKGFGECPFTGNESYSSIKCIVETGEFTTIPLEFDNKQDYKAYCRYCFPQTSGSIEVVANKLNAQGFTIIFPVDKGLYEEACTLGEVAFYTPASILAGFITHTQPEKKQYMLAYLQGKFATFISVKGGKAELINIFSNENGQNTLFYLLSMWKEQGFSQADDTLYMCGDSSVEEMSMIIGRFIKDKKRMNPNGIFKPSLLNKIKGIPFDLQTLILCG